MAANKDWELIVADSAAQKGARILIAKKFPQVHYISFVKNVGYAKIVNAGLAIAKGNYFLIINADILIEPKEIERMLAFLKSKKDAAALGVTASFRFPTLGAIAARRSIWGRTPWGKRSLQAYEMKDYKGKGPLSVDWVRGDCWMMRASAIKQIGLLDERFFMYLEDTDWCRRAKEKGFGIYFLPGIRVEQQQKGASRKPGWRGVRYRFWHLLSFIKFSLKWSIYI